MCNVKTVNLSLNVCQPEGAFWKREAKAHRVRSVGELHKRLLLLALRQVAPQRARELMKIRLNYRGLGSAVLLGVFVGGLIAAGGVKELRRAHYAPRVRVVRTAEF